MTTEAPILKTLGDNITTLPARVTTRITPYLIEAAIEATNFRGSNESLEELKELYHPGSLILYVSSHRSHADVATVLATTREVGKRIPDVGITHLVIAASLARGQQGRIADLFFNSGAKPVLEKYRINTLPVASDNDRNERGIKPSRIDGVNLFNAIVEPNSAIFTFPEASVKGGRRNRVLGLPLGKIKGTQPFNWDLLPTIISIAERKNREVIVVPIGSTGTHNMVSADSRFITPQGLITLALRPASIRIKLATVTYGEPFVLKRSDFADAGEINDLISKRVNTLTQNELK